MNKSLTKLTLAAAFAAFALAQQGLAGDPRSLGSAAAPSDQDTQATLGKLHGLLDEATDDTRKTCVSGQAPGWVSAKRAHNAAVHFADASDMCIATLSSVGGDRRLLAYYRDWLTGIGGDPGIYAAMPRSIGAAVLNGDGKAAVGNGKAVVVTSALAFDAGFTAAYMSGAPKKEVGNAQQLKTVAEHCLAQQQDAGTCFSVGYVYGARAFNTRE